MTRATLPLRWTLPLVLALVGLVGGSLAAFLDIRGARRDVVADLTDRIQVLGTLVGGAVEVALRAGQPGDAKRAVQGLVADRDLQFGVLLDADGQVQFATVLGLVGQPADSLTDLSPVLQDPQRRWQRGVARTGSAMLVGQFPVLLEVEPGALLPSRTGLLVLAYNLEAPIRAATLAGLRRGALLVGIGLTLALLVGLAFRLWITHRVELLVAATRAMASGEYQIAEPVRGRDELAQVGEALGRLGEQLAAQAGLETQLRQAQKMDAFGQFAGGVAHDFNNILAAIAGHVGLLLEETPRSDPRHPDLREIERSTERAAELTRQLLTFSRQDVTRIEPVAIGDTVRGVETMLRRLLGAGIRLEIDIPEGLGAVRIDRGQLEQVLVNLALNARDAMPEGGTLTIEAREVEPLLGWSEALPAGRYLHVTVRDSGHGIEPAVAGRIFEPFFTTKPVGQGTGLGLATVHGIIRQAGGAIRVGHADRGGAELEFVLPWAGPTVPAPDTLPRALPPAGQAEVVLLIDDEPAVLDVFGRILVRGGYSPLLASDAVVAESLAREHAGRIALIISDVLMPDGDGVALVRRLRALVGHVPALFISGYADVHTEALTVLHPRDTFLLKPVSAHVLLRRVHEMLHASEREGARG